MRPVDPGLWPRDLGGDQVVYSEYGHARPNLGARLGHYCSYCGLPVLHSMAVEHVVSKSHDPKRERDWSNFLLACVSCNSTKGEKIESEAQTADYLWPHRDRTFDAFEYADGFVGIAAGLDAETEAKARATDELVGLSRWPSKEQIRKGSDRRMQFRRRAHRVAVQARANLEAVADPELRARLIETICDSAEGHGFWSVWMSVFAGHRDVQDALCSVFPGTALDRVHPLPPHAMP